MKFLTAKQASMLSPQEMVARLTASYLMSYHRAGRNVSPMDVAREAVAELEFVDAAKRAGDGTKVDTKPSVPRGDPLKEAQIETGTRLSRERVDIDAVTTDSPHRLRPVHLHRNPMTISERWGAATARIARILEGAAGSTLAGAVANAQIPHLAKQYTETWGYYLTRSKPPPANRVDHNPFRGQSDKDASRKFMRLVEDICDKSTGVLGSWFVK